MSDGAASDRPRASAALAKLIDAIADEAADVSDGDLPAALRALERTYPVADDPAGTENPRARLIERIILRLNAR